LDQSWRIFLGGCIHKKTFVRVNDRIHVPEIRLIGKDGAVLGLKPTQEAIRIATDQGLDLIEVAPNAKPPVCKIGNFSKFLYEKEKKSKESRKSRSSSQVKEVRFRIKIGEHDFIVKADRINRFLKERHKVRVSCVMFGREMKHKDLAQGMIQKVEEYIKGHGVIEDRPQMYGNRLIAILVPHKG